LNKNAQQRKILMDIPKVATTEIRTLEAINKTLSIIISSIRYCQTLEVII
jgi:hypothetical protein